MMKAIICQGIGGSEVLALGEAPTPQIKANEILIKVKATAINRADTLQRKGAYPPPKGESELLGLEVAGIIEEVENADSNWKKGDRVMALLGGGGYAEYVAVNEGLVMPVPDKLSFQEAAGIPEVFLTAYQALFYLADLQANETVLLHAGASGVGTAAIQLIKKVGAKVIITASTPEKIDACKQLGADVGINYKEENFAERVKEITEGKGVNVIIDFVGASYYEKNIKSIATDGRWVVLAMLGGRKADGFDFGRLLMKRVKLMGSTLRSRSLAYKSQLIQDFSQQFLSDFSQAHLQPVIDCQFNWEEVAKAHDYIEANRNIGKVVLVGM